MAMTTRTGVSDVRSNLFLVTNFYHKVTFGASGAVSSQSSGTGVTVARTGTGVYTFTLDQKYVDCVFFDGKQFGGTLAGGTWEVSTDLATGNVLTVTHLAQDGTPAAGDPAQAPYQFVIAMKYGTSGASL